MFETVRSRRWSQLALVAALASFLVLIVAACGSSSDESGSPQPQVQADQLIVATTTSLNDSGLLEDVILPAYKEMFPDVTVKVVAVGSGEAMAMGAKGEADVLMVHSPDDEAQFMADGNGTLRLPFAYNYFVIVGPQDDPASLRAASSSSASAAFASIAESGNTFVSRGDESGTNKKELEIWESVGITPEGDSYLSTGQGMAETLRIASEKQGYTLADLGTFLSQRDTLDLAVLSKETEDLKNVYDVIIVNQNKFPAVNAASSEQLAQLLVSKTGQAAIAVYGKDTYGQPPFSSFANNLGEY